MKHIEHLYVTGDSFSFGQELGDPPTGKTFYDFTPYMRKTSYTGIIADTWGVLNYTNTSVPGGSNDHIHRRIMMDIPALLKTTSADKLFVMISLTHPARREFYYTGYNRWVPLIVNYSRTGEGCEPLRKLWKVYTAYFDSHEEHSQRYMSQVLSMQAFLKLHGIDYLMTESMVDRPSLDDKLMLLPVGVADLIDRKHYPKLQSFAQYNSYIGAPTAPGGHPLEIGHSAWANFLMEYMKTNKMGKYSD